MGGKAVCGGNWQGGVGGARGKGAEFCTQNRLAGCLVPQKAHKLKLVSVKNFGVIWLYLFQNKV